MSFWLHDAPGLHINTCISMQSGVILQQLQLLTAEGEILLTLKVHFFLVPLPGVPSQLNASTMTDCTSALQSFLLFLQH